MFHGKHSSKYTVRLLGPQLCELVHESNQPRTTLGPVRNLRLRVADQAIPLVHSTRTATMTLGADRPRLSGGAHSPNVSQGTRKVKPGSLTHGGIPAVRDTPQRAAVLTTDLDDHSLLRQFCDALAHGADAIVPELRAILEHMAVLRPLHH